MSESKGDQSATTPGEGGVVEARRSGGMLLSLLGLAVALAVAGFAFWGALDGPFLFDDRDSILDNPSLRSLALPDALWASKQNPFAGRPVVNLSFALNYAACELAPFGYRLTNLAIHFASAAILFEIVRRTLAGSTMRAAYGDRAGLLALASTLLWTVHPLQTEVICYVTQRTELLMALFYLATLYAAIRAWTGSIAWNVASVGCCALAMASKESAVTAPVLVVLYDLAFVERNPRALLRRRGALYAGLCATWIVLAGLMASGPRDASVGVGLGMTPFEYLQTQCWAIGRYLRLAVWPDRQTVDYGYTSVTDLAATAPGAIAIGALAALTIWGWVRRPGIGFLGSWFFLILAPTSSVIPIVTEIAAERRMYLPLAALAVGFVVALDALLRRAFARPTAAKALVAATLALAVVLALRTRERSEVYASELAAWNDAVATTPTNARAHLNLAETLLREDRFAEAERSARRTIELEPTAAAAWRYLAMTRRRQGDLAEALVASEKALAIDDEKADYWVERGHVARALGDGATALAAYGRATELRPDLAEAHNNLGAMIARSDPQAAIPILRRAVELDAANAEARVNLGNALARIGKFDDALAEYAAALAIEPEHPQATANQAAVRQMQAAANSR